MRFLAIGTMLVAACTKPLPVVPQLGPLHSTIADAKTSAEPPPVVTTVEAPIVVPQPPIAIPDARCEYLRLENERKAREFEASLPAGPEAEKKALVKQLLDALRPCLSGLRAVWGLSFVWPPPLMALEANPPRGMDPMAWDQHLLLQVVRVNDDNDAQRACAKVGAAGPIACLPPASGRAMQSDRTAVPILVFEQSFALEELVDLDHDGNDELVVRQDLGLESYFTWFDIWSFAGGRLIPFGPTQAMNIVAIGDFDEDGKVDIATRAGRAQTCHERSYVTPGTNEVRIWDECYGSAKVSPALMRRNLGGGHFAPPSDEIETDVSGQPDRRAFKY